MIRNPSGTAVYVDPQVSKVRALYADILAGDFYALPIRRQLQVQADRLLQAFQSGDDAVCFQIGSWHPTLVGMDDEAILRHSLTIDEARHTIAREYGYKDWDEAAALGTMTSYLPFEQAVNAMLAGDLAQLKYLIGAEPALVSERSQYGHDATLLHYVGSNGVESYRQVVPLNLAEIVEYLLAAGADARSAARIYGGSTPRALFDSSKHSYEAKVHEGVSAIFDTHESKPS